MANLGSENTPIEGESFGLPSGYSFDEEGGDLVIRDTDGTVAMRRAGGTWGLESDLALNENDISGVGAFDSESVNAEQGTIASAPSGDKDITNKEYVDDQKEAIKEFSISGEELRIDIPDAPFVTVEFDRLAPDSNGDVFIQFSRDGGDTFIDGSEAYRWAFDALTPDGTSISAESGGSTGEGGDNSITLLVDAQDSASNYNPVTLEMADPQAPGDFERVNVRGKGTYLTEEGGETHHGTMFDMGGVVFDDGDVDTMRVYAENGEDLRVASGRVKASDSGN